MGQVQLAREFCEDMHLMSDLGWLQLFVNATPGSILTGSQREICRSWPDQTEAPCPGIHFIQEDSGQRIGEAIGDRLTGIEG